MGWTVRGSNPGGRRDFFAPIETGTRAHPASYRMGTMSFLGVKRPGRGLDPPNPSSAEHKEKVALYLYSPLKAFVASSRAKFTFTFAIKKLH